MASFFSWLLVVKLIGPAAVPESHQAQLHLASRRACLLSNAALIAVDR